jgi:hypothetical protein
MVLRWLVRIILIRTWGLLTLFLLVSSLAPFWKGHLYRSWPFTALLIQPLASSASVLGERRPLLLSYGVIQKKKQRVWEYPEPEAIVQISESVSRIQIHRRYSSSCFWGGGGAPGPGLSNQCSRISSELGPQLKLTLSDNKRQQASVPCASCSTTKKQCLLSYWAWPGRMWACCSSTSACLRRDSQSRWTGITQLGK